MQKEAELFLQLERTTLGLTFLPELSRSSLVLCSDVEGPWFLGDFIDQAMSEKCKPPNGKSNTSLNYGHIIYEEMWSYLNQTTSHLRRTDKNQLPRSTLSLSQEGTDTIFTLPLLLATGTSYEYLKSLTFRSKPTQGAQALIAHLQSEGVAVFGITTAPQEPYRALVEHTRLLNPRQVIGSPFPMDETRELLIETGRWDEEMGIAGAYLKDCYQIVDENSQVIATNGSVTRSLTPLGKSLLFERIGHFLHNELGITYDPQLRKSRGPAKTIIGQVIESSGIVGDRAKTAIALNAHRKHGARESILVTMGDGLNDTLMLRRAQISIGINGADAAKAAKIAVVTEDMQNIWPILEQILAGQRDIDTIVQRAQAKVGSTAIITRGGPDIPYGVLQQHRLTKRKLRGNIIY